MSDDNENRETGLVGPDNRPIRRRGDGRTPRSRQDQKAQAESKGISEARAAELIVAGVAAGAKNIYDQLAAESSRNFEKFEDEAVRRVLAEIERRSWRGRIRLRWLVLKETFRGYCIEFGLIDPTKRSERLVLEKPTES